jgi:serine/threonine-protein kinase HipA
MSDARLIVELYGERVGALVRRRGGGVSFLPEAAWVEREFRPVLGVHWLIQRGSGERHANTHLPEWFENLLPERDSALRERMAQAVGLRGTASYDLLARLGHDLPGALVVRPEGEVAEQVEASGEITDPSQLRFSLAGMQLKFSVSMRQQKLGLPARNEDGDWIVKLATGNIPELAEVEAATMDWAAACGFEVPEHRVVPVREVSWLAGLASNDDENAFVIRRYDRTAQGRVHQEDMAQALGVGPQHKYSDEGRQAANHDGLARLVRDACGEEQLREYVRRLVFVIASGNTDAHLKNWSFLLPPHGKPRLTPLYDQVAVVSWERFGWGRLDLQRPQLALGLGGNRNLSQLGFERFHPLAQRVGWSHDEVEALVRQTLGEIFAALPRISMPERMRVAVAEHARQVRLLFDFADFG